MNTARFTPLRLGLFAVFILAMLGCTLTGTTKDILSSTTPGDWYTEDGVPKAEYKVNAFVALNLENLKTDMARGEGEYLASLSALLNVSPQRKRDFFSLLQQRYPSLASEEQAGVSQRLIALSYNLRARPRASEWSRHESRSKREE